MHSTGLNYIIKKSWGYYNPGNYKVFMYTPIQLHKLKFTLLCHYNSYVFSSLVERRLVGFVCLFFLGKHISRFSGLTSWNMRMVGNFNRSCRRKCVLLPDGHRMRRFNALVHCLLDASEYADDLKDFVIDFDITSCFHSILLCILLCIFSIQKEVWKLCENLSFIPINTQALKQLNSSITFWETRKMYLKWSIHIYSCKKAV